MSKFLLDILQTTTTTVTAGKDYQHEVNIGKWIALPLIFLLIAVACLIPHVLIRLKKGAASIAIAICTCISGGALLGIGLMHILPHAQEYWSLWLIPAECQSDSHAGHSHSFIAPTTPIIYQPNSPQRPMSNHFLQRMLDLNQAKGVDNDEGKVAELDFETSSLLSTLQSIEPVDPATLIPSPVAPEEEAGCGDTDHLFPYAQLCCGLVIMLLMATESFLHTYLSGRGKDAVHLHDHGDGEACGHQHDNEDAEKDNYNHHDDDHKHDHHDHGHGHDHKHHDHGHGHDHNHHKHGNEHHLGDCEDQVIELQPVSPSITTNEGDNNSNTPPIRSNEEGSHHHRDANNNEPNSDKITDTIEAHNVDEHGHPLTDEEVERARFRRTVDAYISALAISLHCIFNGLSLGVFTADSASEASSFWTLFGATIGHKLMDGFAVGIPLFRANLPRITNAIIIILVSISTPVGILIGYFASNVKTNGRYLAQAILMSLSAGSFFYISLLEMIPNGVKVIDKKKWLVMIQWLCVGIGFGVSAAIAKWA